MLELARGVSQWAHGFKHAVIFLFNTGEEEGLNGAHSFVTQVGITFFPLILSCIAYQGYQVLLFWYEKLSSSSVQYASLSSYFSKLKTSH